MKTTIHKSIFIFSMIILMLTNTSCSKKPSDIAAATVNSLAFDTVIQITLYENTSDKQLSVPEMEAILAQTLDICKRYDALFSKTTKDSDVYRINHGNGSPQVVSYETIALLKEAIYYSELTDGKIDITVSKVKELWDFSTQEKHASADCIPDSKQLEQALSHVDYHKILIDEENSTVLLSDKEAELDFGFIAKGYIADQLKQYLISQGIEHAIINLGGNVLTIGTKPSGSPFIVGIEKPFDTSDYIEKVSVQDKSVVTGGIYERYFQSDGVIYHHILDPDTGFPVKTDLLSATIIADSSLKADALSTACILIGSQAASSFIEADKSISAVLVTDSYEVIKINCD